MGARIRNNPSFGFSPGSMLVTTNNKVSILISDDGQSLSEQIVSLTMESGLNVVGIVDKGEKAVESYFRLKPEVVLLSFNMKSMNGIDTAQIIKGGDPDAKVILLTDASSPSLMAMSLNAGVRGICMNSTASERIIAGIKCVVSGEVWIDENFLTPLFKEDSGRTASSDELAIQAAKLSERELDVLQLVSKGYSNRKIGEELFISVETVKSHLKRIMERLSANDRTEAAVKAVRLNLL